MSADRWSNCPRCFDINLKEIERLEQIIRDYENGSGRPTDEEEDAYNKAESRLQQFSDTMRQDWDIDLDDDGEFSIDYRASCSVCGFSFKHKHTEKAAI